MSASLCIVATFLQHIPKELIAITKLNCFKSNYSISFNVLVTYLKCFLVRDNFNFIFNTKLSSKSIELIHGLRAISACWIIVGHLFYYAYGAWDNLEIVFIDAKSWILQPVFVAQCFTDSFFALRFELIIDLHMLT
jgi:hypothetical protein